MNWITDTADRAAGALQGARDAVRGTTYEPGRWGEIPRRDLDAESRWRQQISPRNAYERDAFAELDREAAGMENQTARWAAADREAAGEADEEPEARPVSETEREYPPGRPATALEAAEALEAGGLSNPDARDAILSYLAPGPEPRWDTPQGRADAEAEAQQPEAGR